MTTPLSDYQAARVENAHRAYCDYMRGTYGLPEFDDEGWFLYKDDKAAAIHSEKRIIAALLAADAVPRPTQGIPTADEVAFWVYDIPNSQLWNRNIFIEYLTMRDESIRQEARNEAWQDIESAPHEKVLLYNFTSKDYWVDHAANGYGKGTVWQPLPPPPALKEAKNV